MCSKISHFLQGQVKDVCFYNFHLADPYKHVRDIRGDGHVVYSTDSPLDPNKIISNVTCDAVNAANTTTMQVSFSK